MAERLLTIEEVSGMTRQPVGTLRYWRHLGVGPPSARIGRRVMYRESDVLAWLDRAFKDEARLSRGRSAETARRSA
ncbi:MAG TPA: helix-turn-helix domain-containing protein [Nocardioides sp.]|nr:helix-turn-helix domain-containing protein [Nocardioides sp.]